MANKNINIKNYKPTTSSRRHMSVINYREFLTKVKPTKNLLITLPKHSGRNNQGKITVRHQGGGNKRRYRLIDFQRKVNGQARVESIEYNPYGSAFIALINYYKKSGKKAKSYILAPKDLKVSDFISNSENAEIKTGNCLLLKNIPEGTFIHNIELNQGAGGVIARSAGVYAQVVSQEEGSRWTLVKMPSGEKRKILNSCRATIGVVSNEDHHNLNIGKAGKNRYLRKRPTVRGSAMNRVDHPHGGGEGKAPRGMHPKTAYGKPAFGIKTRNKKRASTRLIVTDRRFNKRKKKK
jgi:large subunit ribosomal protein L2